MLTIRWWLHACFEIEYEGKKLVIDPHDGGSLGVGLNPPATRADYVLITHDHYDHNADSVVAGDRTLVVKWRTGEFSLGPFRIKGVKLPHDEYEGRLRGFVVAYRIEAGNISIVHLSDLGRPLRPEEAEELKPVHIVMLPAGNVYTLHPRQALDSAALLDVKIVIPMHYWIPGMQLPLEPLDTLLRYAKKWRVVRYDSNEISLGLEDIPEQRTLLVLAPPGQGAGRHG
ncbi:MBL fold metallo-hydrolase [Hyperthermus butylicus]|uniref:MBL fold metallo-hydrolase n=1 Tax=Hyperthermus butylicus TaxID=54248 RepID=UPI001E59F416|nr:MBL fold metallo-hydrolase [Hyperthermus butylicus]